MHNPTLLIVTDRNDLDGQLFETFSNAQELLKQTPVQANNRDELRQLLLNVSLAELFLPRYKSLHCWMVRVSIHY
jgi:type I site-specific restriction-modification system R (restriction) subunit